MPRGLLRTCTNQPGLALLIRRGRAKATNRVCLRVVVAGKSVMKYSIKVNHIVVGYAILRDNCYNCYSFNGRRVQWPTGCS